MKKPTEPLEEKNGGGVPPNEEITGQRGLARALGPCSRGVVAGEGSGGGRSGCWGLGGMGLAIGTGVGIGEESRTRAWAE